jgi:hypothetical protein
VGIRTALQLVQGTGALDASSAPDDPRRRPTPMFPNSQGADLTAIVVAGDLFDIENQPVTRREAMSVPAVARARGIICTQLARFPLAAEKSGTDLPVEEQPAWLYRTNGGVAPQLRTLWTLDDMMFTGYAVWLVTRGAKRQVTFAERVPPSHWRFDDEWNLRILPPYVDEERQARADEVIIFTSPMDGLLDIAGRTIRAARNLEDSWAARVADPIPHTVIRQTEDIELADDPDDPDSEEISEAQELVNNYVMARRQRTGAVTFVPYGYAVEEFGTVSPDLFIQGRNAVKLDIANFTGLRASLLDASPSSASLTYTSTETGREELVDDVAGWALALTARLSMDDVVPAGTSIRFDPHERPAVED